MSELEFMTMDKIENFIEENSSKTWVLQRFKKEYPNCGILVVESLRASEEVGVLSEGSSDKIEEMIKEYEARNQNQKEGDLNE